MGQGVEAEPATPNKTTRRPVFKLLAVALIATSILLVGIRSQLNITEGLVKLSDRNYILTARASGGQSLNTVFLMRGNDAITIRDCTLYTSLAYVPEPLRRYYFGSAVESISVGDSANLTMINVRVVPSVQISTTRRASVTLINVSNYDSAWTQGWESAWPNQQNLSWGTLGINYKGMVVLTFLSTYEPNYARVRIENSSIGAIIRNRLNEGSNVSVVNSWVAGNNSNTIWLNATCTIDKTTYRQGEPITMRFMVKNPGPDVDLSLPTCPGFEIVAWKGVLPYTLRVFPSFFKPISNSGGIFKQGETIAGNVTWPEPPLQSGEYVIQGRISVPLNTPSPYYNPHTLFAVCGNYNVTIT